MKRIAVLVCLGICLLSACADQDKAGPDNPVTAVMRYEDFGPQVMAYELIGFEWWQWQAHGDSDPTKRYDIRVVVYRNISLEDVRRQYPVRPEILQDYRYLSYEDAMKHLDKNIVEAEEALPALAEQLRATRHQLKVKFAPQT